LPPATCRCQRHWLSALGPSRSYYSFAELSVPADRHQHALKLLIEHGRARGGCLYLRAGDVGLQLVAAIGIERPSHELERELLQRIERAQSLSQSLDALDEETKVFDSTPAAALIRNSMLAPSMPVTDRLSGRPVSRRRESSPARQRHAASRSSAWWCSRRAWAASRSRSVARC
jgi:hypothetical protein